MCFSFIGYPVLVCVREMIFGVELVPSQDVFHLSSGASSGVLHYIKCVCLSERVTDEERVRNMREREREYETQRERNEHWGGSCVV